MSLYIVSDIEGQELVTLSTDSETDRKFLYQIYCEKKIEDFEVGEEYLFGYSGNAGMIRRVR